MVSTTKLKDFTQNLPMGNLYKNDGKNLKVSFQSFSKKSNRNHNRKYKIDCSHHCKYLLTFISFTTDNIVLVRNSFLVCFTNFHLNLFNMYILHKRSCFTSVNTELIDFTSVNTC